MKTAVIGGGAAGLCAAVAAREKGDEVVLFERMDRVGKKLLATGNGRCNIMNTGPLRYTGGAAFAQKVLSVCSREALCVFFEKHGLALREEAQGRVYPATGQAATVLNVLLNAAVKTGVCIRTGMQVTAVGTHANGTYAVFGEPFDKLIISGGGKAQPRLGSDGSAHALLLSLGHPITALSPALVPLRADMSGLRGLSGLRVTADVFLEAQGREYGRETGEVLFANDGLSGVCIMQLSRLYRTGACIRLDLRRAMNFTGEDLLAYLADRRASLPNADASGFLTGLFAEPVARVVRERAGLRQLTDDALKRLAHTLVHFTVPLTGTRGFNSAQVTAGGADLSFFNPENLESTLHKRLHAAGEVLDVDGDCGGYNLMFAFCSGIAAARAD